MAEAAAPPSEKVWTKDEVLALATEQASLRHLNGDRFIKTISCEVYTNPDGTWDVKGQSQYKDKTGPNGLEDSWGPAMIHLPDHPEITREQAQDPSFAIPWMATEWSNGGAHLWSCYKLLYP